MNSIKSPKGFSTLEFALVIPVVLGFVFGTLALGRMFQARTVLQEGLRSSIRNLKSIDGSSTGATFKAPVAYYDWYQINAKPLYPVDTYHYSGDLSWIEKPQYLFKPSARVLSDVEAVYPRTQMAYRPIEYAVEGEVSAYVVAARSPYVASADGKTIQFRYRRDQGKEYPPTFVESIKDIALKSSDDNRIEMTHTFVIPRPAAARTGKASKIDHCFEVVNDKLDLSEISSSDINFDSRCWVAVDQDYVNVVINITGINTENESGEVQATFRWDEDGEKNVTQTRLKLREKHKGRSENFVPIGADLPYLDPKVDALQNPEDRLCRESEMSEENSYGTIQLPYNKKIQFTARLIDNKNDLQDSGWRGRMIQVFAPQFTVAKVKGTCLGQTVKASQLPTLNIGKDAANNEPFYESPYGSCLLSKLKRPSFIPARMIESGDTADDTSTPSTTVTDRIKVDSRSSTAWDSDVDSVKADKAKVITDKNVSTATFVKMQEALSPSEQTLIEQRLGINRSEYEVVKVEPDPEPFPFSHACPTKNISVVEKAGSDGYVYNSARAALDCPIISASDSKKEAIVAPEIDRIKRAGNPAPSTIRWKEESVPLKDVELAWVKNDCRDSFQPPPIQDFPAHKIELGLPRFLGRVPSYTGSQDPTDVLASENYSSCKDFTRVERKIPWAPAGTAADSLFTGEQLDLGDCLQAKLRAEATKLGQPAEAYFVVHKERFGSQSLVEPPDSACGVPFKTEYENEGTEQLLTMSGPIPAGEKPEKCTQPKVICKAVLSKMESDKVATTREDGEKFKIAEKIGIQAIAAAMPGVPRCVGGQRKDCFEYSLSEYRNDQQQLVYRGIASTEIDVFGFRLGIVTASTEALAEINFAR